MNKAKQILMSEVRKLRSKAELKRREADRLDSEDEELEDKANSMN